MPTKAGSPWPEQLYPPNSQFLLLFFLQIFLWDPQGEKQLMKKINKSKFCCILGGNELGYFEMFPQGSDFRAMNHSLKSVSVFLL